MLYILGVVNGDCRPQSRKSLGTISLAESPQQLSLMTVPPLPRKPDP